MPDWTRRPPTTDAQAGIRLVRCPPTGKLVAIILSRDLIGTRTHYDGTRTKPCEGESCPLCSKGYPWRWHGYLALWLPLARERVLLELTASASERIADAVAAQGHLRGLDITITRPRQKPNSRVVVQVGSLRHSDADLPDEPDTPRILTYIWSYRVSPDDLADSADRKFAPSRETKAGDGRGEPLATRNASPPPL